MDCNVFQIKASDIINSAGCLKAMKTENDSFTLKKRLFVEKMKKEVRTFFNFKVNNRSGGSDRKQKTKTIKQ